MHPTIPSADTNLTFSYSGMTNGEISELLPPTAAELTIFRKTGALPPCDPQPTGHLDVWVAQSPPEAENALRFNYCAALGELDINPPIVAEYQAHTHSPYEVYHALRRSLDTSLDPELDFRRVAFIPNQGGHDPRHVVIVGTDRWAILDLDVNALIDLDPGPADVRSVCYEDGSAPPCTTVNLLGGQGAVVVDKGNDTLKLYVTHTAAVNGTNSATCSEIRGTDRIAPHGTPMGSTVTRYTLTTTSGRPQWLNGPGDRAAISGPPNGTVPLAGRDGFCGPADIIADLDDGSEVYVTHYRSGAMSVIDTDADTVTRTFGRPAPEGSQSGVHGIRSRQLAIGEVEVDVYDDTTGELVGTETKPLVFMTAATQSTDVQGTVWAIDPSMTAANRIVAKFLNVGTLSTNFDSFCPSDNLEPPGNEAQCGLGSPLPTSKVGRTPQGIAFYSSTDGQRKYLAVVNSTPVWNFGRFGYEGEAMLHFVTNLAIVEVTRLRQELVLSDTNRAVRYDLDLYRTIAPTP